MIIPPKKQLFFWGCQEQPSLEKAVTERQNGVRYLLFERRLTNAIKEGIKSRWCFFSFGLGGFFQLWKHQECGVRFSFGTRNTYCYFQLTAHV